MIQGVIFIIWYKDDKYIKRGKSCDNSINNFLNYCSERNSSNLLFHYAKYRNMGNKNSHYILKASYYYWSFNCLNTYLQKFEVQNNNIRLFQYNHFKNDYNSIVRECLYLGRMFLIYLSKYEKSKHPSKEEISYLNGLILSFTTNYANLLDEIGRIISSIKLDKHLLSRCNKFSMSQGNLGLDLYRYSKFTGDIHNKRYLLNQACYHLRLSLTYHLARTYKKAFWKFYNWYKISEKLCINKEKHLRHQQYDSPEIKYRCWISKNCLSLNVFNDINYSKDTAKDNILLPYITNENSTLIYNLFNSTKQEYSSARFQIYQGFKNYYKKHYSDNYIKTMKTPKNYIFNYHLEQVKMAFKMLFSIFDHIAFILKNYSKAPINKKYFISFKILFKNKNTVKKLFKYYKNNYALRGLYWIREDLYRKEGNEIGLDHTLYLAQQIRNAIEHRCLFITKSKKSYKLTNYDTVIINIKQFKIITIHLISVSREAIILLVIFIRLEESFR